MGMEKLQERMDKSDLEFRKSQARTGLARLVQRIIVICNNKGLRERIEIPRDTRNPAVDKVVKRGLYCVNALML